MAIQSGQCLVCPSPRSVRPPWPQLVVGLCDWCVDSQGTSSGGSDKQPPHRADTLGLRVVQLHIKAANKMSNGQKQLHVVKAE